MDQAEFWALTPAEFYNAQQTALMRLHLKATGDIHGWLGECGEQLRRQLVKLAGAEGQLSPLAGPVLAQSSNQVWGETFGRIRQRLDAGRRQAALLGFVSLVYWHGRLLGGEVSEALRQAQDARRWAEAEPPVIGIEPLAFFQPQLEEVLAATADRVYSDGFRLSQRIWNLDETSRVGIQQIIAAGIAGGNSAWNIAPQLEQYLGAGSDCPRWTRDRLFGLTKTDIAAGDETGLLRGTPCVSRGVAYNALRLARNEIQIAHAAATDAILARQPWVEAEKINLSPSHPPIDCVCEEVANGGDKGDGVYPKGTIALPLHVQCLCFKTGELIKDEEFISRLRGWMNGSQPWAGMDVYAGWVGATAKTIGDGVMLAKLYAQLALPLITWLEGNEAEVEALLA